MRVEYTEHEAICREIRKALNLPPDNGQWKADLPKIVETLHLQLCETTLKLRREALDVRMDAAAVRMRDETEDQLKEARKMILEWLGLVFVGGRYMRLENLAAKKELNP